MEKLRLNPEAASPVIDLLTTADVPVILWGDPGTGKTRFVRKWAQDRGYKHHTLIGSQLEPTDIGGYPIPQPDMGGVKFVTPEWFQKIRRDEENGQKWVLFLDELSCATPGVQAAMFSLICEREINNERLPDSTRLIAASNDVNVSTSLGLTEPMLTRLAHIDWVPYSLMEVAEHSSEGWPTPHPPNMKETNQTAKKAWLLAIASIAEHRPAWSNDLAHGGKVAAAGRGYPCTRSWTNLSNVLSLMGTPSEVDLGLMASVAVAIVGTAPGLEFTNTVRDMGLPSPEDWLSDPQNVKPLSRDDANFTVLASVAAAVDSNFTQKRWRSALDVVLNIGEQGATAVCAPAMAELVRMLEKSDVNPKTGEPKKRRATPTPAQLQKIAPFRELWERSGFFESDVAR